MIPIDNFTPSVGSKSTSNQPPKASGRPAAAVTPRAPRSSASSYTRTKSTASGTPPTATIALEQQRERANLEDKARKCDVAGEGAMGMVYKHFSDEELKQKISQRQVEIAEKEGCDERRKQQDQERSAAIKTKLQGMSRNELINDAEIIKRLSKVQFNINAQTTYRTLRDFIVNKVSEDYTLVHKLLKEFNIEYSENNSLQRLHMLCQKKEIEEIFSHVDDLWAYEDDWKEIFSHEAGRAEITDSVAQYLRNERKEAIQNSGQPGGWEETQQYAIIPKETIQRITEDLFQSAGVWQDFSTDLQQKFDTYRNQHSAQQKIYAIDCQPITNREKNSQKSPLQRQINAIKSAHPNIKIMQMKSENLRKNLNKLTKISWWKF